MARRTNVSVPTLRTWEERHGFPVPARLASGHRRYGERDCQAVLEIVRLRASGLSLETAIARSRRSAESAPTSLFAGLRSGRPELAPWLVRKRRLAAISRAIEDEWAARAEPGLLVGSFQRERFYRASEPRWRELGRTSALALVFADFERLERPAGAPVEVPLEGASPLVREWAIVADAPGLAACLVGWERPGQAVPDAERVFEAIWSAEPNLVRDSTEIALSIASRAVPELAASMRERLEEPRPADAATLAAVTALTNRIVSYLA